MAISPELEAQIAELARLTVKTGTDPVLVLSAIQTAAQWRGMTPEQRYARLRRLRDIRKESDRARQHP
jgi:hypothetical protein